MKEPVEMKPENPGKPVTVEDQCSKRMKNVFGNNKALEEYENYARWVGKSRADSSAAPTRPTVSKEIQMAKDSGYQDPNKGGNGPGKENRVPFLPK